MFATPIEDVEASEERLYRISPDAGSTARYEVRERIAGSTRTTVGSTGVLAGDIVVNTADPALSRLGEIVVNVETLTSDSVLRDRRIRHDFLESSHWPFVRFAPESVTVRGPTAGFADGSAYDITVTGHLTIKRTTLPETFSGTVTAHEDRLTAHMSAVVLGSEYGVGPVNIARLAHTSDEVLLALDVEAERVPLGSTAGRPGQSADPPGEAAAPTASQPGEPTEPDPTPDRDLRRDIPDLMISEGGFRLRRPAGARVQLRELSHIRRPRMDHPRSGHRRRRRRDSRPTSPS